MNDTFEYIYLMSTRPFIRFKRFETIPVASSPMRRRPMPHTRFDAKPVCAPRRSVPALMLLGPQIIGTTPGVATTSATGGSIVRLCEAYAIANVGRVESLLVDEVKACKIPQLAEAGTLFVHRRRRASRVLLFLDCFGVLALFHLSSGLPSDLALVRWSIFEERYRGKGQENTGA